MGDGRSEADGQRHLFELEPSISAVLNEEDVSDEEPPVPPRRKKRRSQKDKLDHLPQRRIPMDVSDEDKHCETCGGEKTKIGEDERRVLQFRPAVLEVDIFILPKYACPCCQAWLYPHFTKSFSILCTCNRWSLCDLGQKSLWRKVCIESPHRQERLGGLVFSSTTAETSYRVVEGIGNGFASLGSRSVGRRKLWSV